MRVNYLIIETKNLGLPEKKRNQKFEQILLDI